MTILKKGRLFLICFFAFSFLIFHFFINQAPAGQNARVAIGEKIYVHYCSPCHGNNGDGKGFNAKNLDPRPANHTDVNLMTKRTDKELYDAVSGGGKAVGKAAIMPPWEGTLDKGQIKLLVLYLRKLCRCAEE